ncbi:MAG TPA: bifunctional (p)ppGpp synthetase/guanosine-3',5'-bis(diphosphate) 3'-pyrophosphohydrolase [Polyangiaceae bacterium]|jgi:GTP pyrophosphokinase|nr:bifunctional (p)ppGpp synthetase/guanosine-3',5'-bis(diphosphate) 3'-pyrophosphohydrolase [Polyangiaceae bacterium]
MAELTELARRAYPDVERVVLDRCLAEAERLATGVDGQRLAMHGQVAGRMLLEMRLDPAAVGAAVLAPWVTGSSSLPASVSESLSEEVRRLLDGVARLDRIRWHRLEGEAAETLRRMFLAMAKDVRVILIVLALRVLLMRHVNELPAATRVEVASEVLEVFAPLANRLGIWQFKSELEDTAFLVLDPEHYATLSGLLNQRARERQQYIERVVLELRQKLESEGLKALVAGRPKHIYSIWKKMQKKHVSFEQIYDVSAVRVITERTQDCYGILGVVHSMWHPIKGEFDDYVAMPKSNGYQSLHTAVIGPLGLPVEVQIRTFEMHRFAEYGVAAHWAYKERRDSAGLAQDKFMLLRRLLDWEQELKDPKQFVESLKTDLFEDQVYVFTPKGDIVDLPKGATPLDFAYRIHTLVGHRTRGARVNDQIVPLDYELKTGDRVEMLTHSRPEPSRDWMNVNSGYLRTPSARSKVRHWFREQDRDQAIAAGRELLKRELAKVELRHTKHEDIASALEFTTLDDLFAAIGYGDKSPQVAASTAIELERAHAPESDPSFDPGLLPQAEKRPRSTSGLSLHGVPDVMGNRARCCNPLPGDDVVGFVTRGRGIVIHRRDCDNVHDSPERERWVEIDWGPDAKDSHTVSLEIEAQDDAKVLPAVVKLVGSLGAKVVRSDSQRAAGDLRVRLSITTRNSTHLGSVLQRLGALSGVYSARLVEG